MLNEVTSHKITALKPTIIFDDILIPREESTVSASMICVRSISSWKLWQILLFASQHSFSLEQCTQLWAIILSFS